MRKLRVGIVGCGGIANGKHLPAMKRNGNFEFVAFCDLIEERAQKAKEEYGTEDSKVYTDYNDLLKEDIEAVYVLTPNSVHAPVSIAAMEAGKNVKVNGGENNLLELIAADPAFNLSLEELQKAMDGKRYVGRAPKQVEEFLEEVIRPVLEENKEVLGMKAEITV